MKNIIITSGNCMEPIDSVRNIVNSSSGKLGAMIAEKLAFSDCHIYYICSRRSILPTENLCNFRLKKITIIYANSAQEIFDVMQKLLTDKTKNITHVIHARAISDYEVDYVSSVQRLYECHQSICDTRSWEELLLGECRDFLEDIEIKSPYINTSGKLSSDEDNIIIKLRKTPKIISYIKKWNPNVKLFGFKLLDNVLKDELISVAKKQMEKCGCDYVIANDISLINDKQHPAWIINQQGEEIVCNNKYEISEAIIRIVNDNE